MTNEELIKELKILIYEETEDEVDDIREQCYQKVTLQY